MAKTRKMALSQLDVGQFVLDTITNLRSADPKKTSEVDDSSPVAVMRWGRFIVQSPRFPIVGLISDEKDAFLTSNGVLPVYVQEDHCPALARAIRSRVLLAQTSDAMEWDVNLEEVYG